MIASRSRGPRHKGLWAFRLALLLLAVTGPAVPRARAETPAPARVERLPAPLVKSMPENREDLRAIEAQVKRVLARVMPATVGLRLGSVAGSGVLVSEDGYVLTAGHVAGKPGRTVVVILPDGKRVKGETLGVNRAIDSGLVKITEKGKWPFCEMGDSSELTKGQWCIAVGHPEGYQPGRTAPVRFGRVLNLPSQGNTFIRTDCFLKGGDSGGPLFDLGGKVIAIHSRISMPLTTNLHVPVDTYRDTWERLVKGEAWGGGSAYLGIEYEAADEGCRVVKVVPRSPAARYGLKEDDVITTFAGLKLTDSDDLMNALRRREPGDMVQVKVLRGDRVVTLQVELGERKE
jgi:serine protease Do